MSIPYGFVSLEDGGCLVAHSCGSTWGTYEACCPPNSICQGPSKSVCYDTNDRNCTNVLLSKPKCANETWTLYGPDQQEHFCCRPGTVGYKAGIGRWSGCAGHGYKFEVNDRALVPVVAASGGHLDGGVVQEYLTKHVQQYPRRTLSSIPDPSHCLSQLHRQLRQRPLGQLRKAVGIRKE